MVVVISERDSAVYIFEFADWFLQFCYEKVWDLILTGQRLMQKGVVFPFDFSWNVLALYNWLQVSIEVSSKLYQLISYEVRMSSSFIEKAEGKNVSCIDRCSQALAG